MDGWNGMNGNVLLHTHILLERYIKNKYTSELQPPPLLLLPLPQLFSCTYHIRKPSICSHAQPMPRVCVYACGEMTFLHIADRGPNSMCIPGYTRVPNVVADGDVSFLASRDPKLLTNGLGIM